MTYISILQLGNAVMDSSSGRIIQRLISHLGQDAYQWHVGGVCGSGDMEGEFIRLGAKVVDFSNHQNGTKFLAKRIRDYVTTHKIRIVHTHSPRARLTTAMALIGSPQTVHLATEHLLYAPQDRHWGLVYAFLDRATLYPANHVVAVSKKMQRQLAALPGLGNGQVTAIQNAIDCAYYYAPAERKACRSEFGYNPKTEVIGYAGRLDRVKRLDLLLQAFSEVVAEYPQARLLIAGEGDQRSGLEDLADSLGISDLVTWAGFRKDVPRLLAAMDIYIQPSVNEGLSLSILEAMAASKPIVVTDVGGAREVISHQETGILIPPGSSEAIKNALSNLLRNAEKRMALAEAAREHVVQEFGVRRMVEGYRRVYECLNAKLISSQA